MKLPKTFLAVNLSDAFSFQERQSSDPDLLEMKGLERAPGSTPSNAEEEEDVVEENGTPTAQAGEVSDAPEAADQGQGQENTSSN